MSDLGGAVSQPADHLPGTCPIAIEVDLVSNTLGTPLVDMFWS